VVRCPKVILMLFEQVEDMYGLFDILAEPTS